MGGSGGGDGRSTGLSLPSIQARIEEAKEREQQRLRFDVNAFLGGILAGDNGRDGELTTERLNVIQSALGEQIEVDRILFGGSVAKRTAVNGMSDVDALVILDRTASRGVSAEAARE